MRLHTTTGSTLEISPAVRVLHFMSEVVDTPQPANNSAKALHMTVDSLRDRCIKLFGKRGWKKQLAAEIRRDESTIRRWCQLRQPIPGYVDVVLMAIERQRKLDRITKKMSRL